MESHRVVLGWFVAVPLMGDDVDERDESFARFRLFERLFDLGYIVAVNRAQIAETQFRPERGGDDDAVESAAEPFDEPVNEVALGGHAGDAVYAVYEKLILGASDDALAPVGEEADVLGDGHPIVVEDDDETFRVEMLSLIHI